MAAEPFPPRIGPPVTAGERETLRAFLDYQRATLAMKCHGLSDDELRRQSSPPSALSLLGLVRHMAEVERTWFRRVIDGEDVDFVWSDRGTTRSPTMRGRRRGPRRSPRGKRRWLGHATSRRQRPRWT